MKERKESKRVFVVCGGPSLEGFRFSRLTEEDTIVVNKSILDVPLPNYFITIDYTFLKKIGVNCFKRINTTKLFVANFGCSFLKEKNGQIVDTRFDLKYHLESFDKVVRSYRSDGIGFSFDDFRSGANSGYCALQLAVILGYKEIYLLGVDLNTTDKTHYHGGYGQAYEVFNKKLEKYFRLFKTGLLELQSHSSIKVFSCSSSSRLNEIIPFRVIDEVI